MTQLPLVRAELGYLRGLPLGESPEALLARLIEEIPWRQEPIVLWGRRIPQPRLISWHGDSGARYRYSGLVLEPQAWTAALHQIKRTVEAQVGVAFNSVLANYYRDHRDSMGLHSDDEPELGDRPIIASVSLGAERTLVFRARNGLVAPPYRLRLESGSLLVMRGETQRFWRHQLPKQTRPCGPRVNLTFRTILGGC